MHITITLLYVYFFIFYMHSFVGLEAHFLLFTILYFTPRIFVSERNKLRLNLTHFVSINAAYVQIRSKRTSSFFPDEK